MAYGFNDDKSKNDLSDFVRTGDINDLFEIKEVSQSKNMEPGVEEFDIYFNDVDPSQYIFVGITGCFVQGNIAGTANTTVLRGFRVFESLNNGYVAKVKVVNNSGNTLWTGVSVGAVFVKKSN